MMRERSADYNRLINSREWQRVRRRKLKANPVCEICGREWATEVHHIIPIDRLSFEEMKRLAYSETNLQALCRACHMSIHRQARYHTKQQVQANKQARAERFEERFGGGDFSDPTPQSL